jgi:hypothetical protein
VTGRDWKRIETELDEVLPGVVEADDRPAPDPSLQPEGRRADEDILKHIADALRLDKV